MDGLTLLRRAQDAGLRLEIAGTAIKITGPKKAEPLVRLPGRAQGASVGGATTGQWRTAETEECRSEYRPAHRVICRSRLLQSGPRSAAR